VPVKKHSVEQIIAKLREIEKLTAQGMSVPMAAKKVGVTDQTFYRWRIRYGALKEEEAKRLQLLEQENARLKRIVALRPRRSASLDPAVPSAHPARAGRARARDERPRRSSSALGIPRGLDAPARRRLGREPQAHRAPVAS
jgi:hypothetical protein